MKSSGRNKKTTVVDLMCDARFFIERGQRLLIRNDYEKALRCFRRAIDMEPDNAGFYCHLASALAEMGRFEASNDVLHHVLDHIDPQMVDIYFYLANNYANLEDYQKAEEMAVSYLQKAQQGVYVEEAEELLDYIYFELDIPQRHYLGKGDNLLYRRHEEARHCLEEGRFLEAVEILKGIVASDDTFMPAWNNLSLAYYYVGDFAKAMETIELTLEREPGNLHALCNLAVLLSHLNQTVELIGVLSQLKKVAPLHFEHMYKLATTMGVLGQHEEAYHLFKRMLKQGGLQDVCTFHYAAISAYMTGRREQAARWWQKVKQLDQESGIAEYYLQLLNDEADDTRTMSIPYHYYHPHHETIPDQLNWSCPEDFKDNPMIRASLLWALQHGKDDVKEVVLRTLGMIGDTEAEAAVRRFCKETTEPHFQKLALLALAQMGAALPYEVGQSAPATEDGDEVCAAIKLHFRHKEQEALCEWSLNLWHAYCASKEPIRIRKPLAWLAAMEYLYGKMAKAKLNQISLAEKYEVSLPTLAKCIRELTMLI